MRFVCMHKVDAASEAGTPPPAELVQNMGKLIGETAKAGMFLDGGGLRPSALRVRLTFAQGAWKVQPGPLTGRNELPASMAIVKVRSKDEAIEWAKRYGKALAAEEIEVGPLVEPWDLGVCPKPEGDVPLRFMLLHKATREFEAGSAPTPQQQAELARLKAEMVEAGVLMFAETLRPSSEAARLRYRGGERRVIDGPFTESKELIGGFSMVQMRSFDEVFAWTDRFARVIGGDCEVDIRPVAEASDLGRGVR